MLNTYVKDFFNEKMLVNTLYLQSYHLTQLGKRLIFLKATNLFSRGTG